MGQIVYLNGNYVPMEDACISVADRGFLFGDGVYEVVRYYNGSPLAMQRHLERLRTSLQQIRLPLPEEQPDFAALSDELMRRNALEDGCVYWQVTRGSARPRNHAFPPETRPTVYAAADGAYPLRPEAEPAALCAITRPDTRWHHCAIKATSLLANVLDAQAAADADCDEAILIRDGVVTEGTRRSIIIVSGKQLLTYPLDGRILDSITRRIVLGEARQGGYAVQETRYTLDELMRADEVIAVGSTTEVAAVTEVDGQPIGQGGVGAVTADLFERFKQHVFEACGRPR